MSDQDNGESCEQLLNLLHQRLIATGEWSSLLMQLRQMLEDSGWEAKLRDHAERTYMFLDLHDRRGPLAGILASGHYG